MEKDLSDLINGHKVAETVVSFIRQANDGRWYRFLNLSNIAAVDGPPNNIRSQEDLSQEIDEK